MALSRAPSGSFRYELISHLSSEKLMLFVYLPFTGYLLIRYQFSSNPTHDQSPEMLPFVAETLPFATASLSMLALVDVVMFAISKPVAC